MYIYIYRDRAARAHASPSFVRTRWRRCDVDATRRNDALWGRRERSSSIVIDRSSTVHGEGRRTKDDGRMTTRTNARDGSYSTRIRARAFARARSRARSRAWSRAWNLSFAYSFQRAFARAFTRSSTFTRRASTSSPRRARFRVASASRASTRALDGWFLSSTNIHSCVFECYFMYTSFTHAFTRARACIQSFMRSFIPSSHWRHSSTPVVDR